MRKHTLGSPETVPLSRAAKEAGRLLAAAKLGGDPAADARRERGAIKLADLATGYMAHQKMHMKPRSYIELKRHLERHAQSLHSHLAAKVTQRAVVELLQSLVQDAPVTANRVRASLSAMFSWGMKAGLVPSNPVVSTFKPGAERSRERVLSDTELAYIWRATDRNQDHDRIVRLLMLTGSRREEIAGITWSELTWNSDGTATWLLPSARSKNHLPHEVVLPPLATTLLPPAREGRAMLFGDGAGPFSGWSRCKQRLDARIAEAAGAPIPPWVLHDLRRSFVTRLNELGVEPHVIEAMVNHASGSARAGVAGVYNRSTYAVQKRTAMVLWCDHIDRLLNATIGNHVIAKQ
jgi:integrase